MTPDRSDDSAVTLDAGTAAMLQAIFKFTSNEAGKAPTAEALPKTAGVKFMITREDEKGLRDLGYSQAQIDRLKPEEARDILQTATRAVPEPD